MDLKVIIIVDVEDYYNSYMANWFAYEEAGEECSITETILQILNFGVNKKLKVKSILKL